MDTQPAIDPELMEELMQNGYSIIMRVPGRGVCAVIRMVYTVGLCYGLDKTGYRGRYCYETLQEAISALALWDGTGDPPGDWIKHKGRVEYSNPNYIKE